MNNQNNIFHTTQIYSIFQYHEEKTKQRRLSVNILNQSGFIIFMQQRTNNGWKNITNFYLYEHNMPILSEVIDRHIKDLENEDYNKIRVMNGSKSNLHLLATKKKDKLYLGIRIVQKNKDKKETSESNTIMLNSSKTEGVHHGKLELKLLRDKIMETYKEVNNIRQRHFKSYGELISGNNDKDNDDDIKETEDAFPFNNDEIDDETLSKFNTDTDEEKPDKLKGLDEEIEEEMEQ